MSTSLSPLLAPMLSSALPDAPWHTHRDRIAEIASSFAILACTCGKIARDISLLMQTDVAEAFEPAGEGRGGSSTLPHKRNPVAAATALAAAAMAPNLAATIFAAQVQDHERSAGPWHAEWPTLPMLMLITSGALAAITEIAEGLEVDTARMRANLDSTHGLKPCRWRWRKRWARAKPTTSSKPQAARPSRPDSIFATFWARTRAYGPSQCRQTR